ncbi:MAG: histidine phosphatase family protein [Verrucomicrobiota bacterium]
MKILLIMLYIGFALSVRVYGQTNPVPPAVETLICIRHGEKPATGLGQLTCQGLNRALALPKVLLAKYGTPQFLFAPDPTQTITEYAGAYYYVRPLTTIEPTAIYCGLPVNTQFGYTQITELQGELQKDAYQNATIYIAWEHVLLHTFAQDMVETYGGDPTRVPAWPGNDYDIIFVIKITRNQGQESVAFTIDHEGLNNLSTDCLQMQISSASPGVRTNQFGFNITGTSNIVVVVEASTNLANPTWSPLRTNTLTGGSSYFSDPQWTNYSSRFYRLYWP